MTTVRKAELAVKKQYLTIIEGDVGENWVHEMEEIAPVKHSRKRDKESGPLSQRSYRQLTLVTVRSDKLRFYI